MDKSFISAFLLLLLMSCGVPESEYQELENENGKLIEEVADLRSRLAEIEYLKTHSQVVLPYTEQREITSVSNGQTYQIKIQLPRKYDPKFSGYPVLYVTDAETNFGGVGYIVQRLIKDELIPPMIVVGIAYGTDYCTFYELRSRDLTPEEDKTLKMGSNIDPTGGAPKFCEFLSNELFPFIEGAYKVDNTQKTLYGHSYGGLFGAYVLLNNPGLFTNYLILSPSLWFKDELVLSQLDTISAQFETNKLYMASGEHEGKIDDLQRLFISKLGERDFEGLSYESEVMQNETHRTIFGPGFTNGMRYFFAQ